MLEKKPFPNCPVDTGRELNERKTFNLRPVSMGWNLLWLCCVIFIKPNKQIQAQVNNQKTSTRSEIRSNLTTSSSGRRHLLFFDVFIANFEHFTPYSSVYIVEFEQVNDCWQIVLWHPTMSSPYCRYCYNFISQHITTSSSVFTVCWLWT